MSEGAEKIIRRILDDATARAEAIKEEAREQAQLTDAEGKDRAARKCRQLRDQASREAEEQKKRIIGVAQLEARKDVLAAKQELIAKAFQETLDQLLALDERKYFQIIGSLLVSQAETGAENVVFSAVDHSRIPDGFLGDINRALVDLGKKGELTLDSDPGAMKGGFVLKSGGIEINCSFESLIELQRDQLEPAVAAMLFK